MLRTGGGGVAVRSPLALGTGLMVLLRSRAASTSLFSSSSKASRLIGALDRAGGRSIPGLASQVDMAVMCEAMTGATKDIKSSTSRYYLEAARESITEEISKEVEATK